MEQKMQEFYQEVNDEVKQYMTEYRITQNAAFKDVFLSYLNEHGVTVLADMNFVEYKKDSENMRLDGYSYNEYFRSLTLLVCKYNSGLAPEMLWKKDIDKYVKKAVKFLKTCDSDYFENLEPTSDGYDAYRAIKDITRSIDTVNVVFVTNDIAKNYVPDDMKFRKGTINFDVYDIERIYHLIISGDIEYKPLVVRLKNKYHQELSMIKVLNDNPIYDCYVGIIPGKLFGEYL